MIDVVDRRRFPGQPPLSETAGITAGGSLFWLGIVWAILLVVFVAILIVVGVWGGDLDDSLWQQIGAGWQKLAVLAAGATMVPSFGPMLLTNGVTRARLPVSAIVTMALVAVAGGIVVAVGYGVEDVAFARTGWPHVLEDGSDAGGVRFLATVAAVETLMLAAYFVSGWLIGTGFYRFGRDGGVPLIVPSVLPAIAAELLLESKTRTAIFGFVFRPLDAVDEPAAAIGVPATVAVIALACLIATRYTRNVEVRG